MEFYEILVAIAVVWIFIYTLSYGIFTLKEDNISGGVAILVLDLFVILLPLVVYCISYF